MSPAFDREEDTRRRDAILRALVNIPDVLARLGIDKGAKKNGRGRLILCPWHGEKVPSCGVTIGERGTMRFKCMSCQGGGDVLAAIAQVDGLDMRADFPTILGRAADMAGIALPDREAEAPPVRVSREPVVADEPPATLETELAVGKALERLADACPLLGDTRLADGVAARFLLESAVRDGWCALPRVGAEALLSAPEYAALRPILLRDDARGRPSLLFRDHRLVIPWRGPDGRAWSFQRRFAPHTGSEDPKVLGQKVGKYIWPPASVYRPRQVYPYGVAHHTATDPGTKEVWLVEGAPDQMAIHLLNELGALSKKHLSRPLVALGIPGVAVIKAYLPTLAPYLRCRHVCVATDDDRAGEDAKAAWEPLLRAAGAASVSLVTPPGHDWNGLLVSLR